MKNILFVLILLCAKLASAQTASNKVESFAVAGNCGQCKERIEKTTLKVHGVSAATWEEATQVLTVNFDTLITSIDKIELAIAKVGHDTPKYRAQDTKYNTLPTCCLYPREASSTGIQTARFTITGMTCAEGCAKGIEGALYKQRGVKSSEVNFNSQVATVVFDSEKISKADLIRVIESFNPGENGDRHYRAEELK